MTMPEQVPVDETTWYCTTCGETITHQHRPLKPDYHELLAMLREVRAKMHGTIWMGSGTEARVMEMLERAEHGR